MNKILNFKFIYNEEAERSLMIQLLANPAKIQLCASRLPVEAIHNEVYKSIYSSCIKLKDQNVIKLDDLSVELMREWDQSEQCFQNLKEFVLEGASMNFNEALKKVEIAYVKRRLVDIYKEAQQNILTALDVPKAVRYSTEKAMKILSETEGFNFNNKDSVKNIVENLISGKNSENFLPTGLNNLDAVINGLSRQHLTIIAARPSVGKTSLACSLLNYMLSTNKRCIFFSLETSIPYLIYRLLSIRSGISYEQIINNRLSNVVRESLANDLLLINEWIEQGRLIIIENVLSISEIEYQTLRQVNKEGVDMIFVDYLQIVAVNNYRPAYLEYGEILRRIKQLAKDKNISAVVLSQLNRSLEGREDSRPRQSDLAYSGAIEMVSDLILMLNRIKNKEDKEGEQSFNKFSENKIEILISKNRNGRTGLVRQYFNPVSGAFADLRES